MRAQAAGPDQRRHFHAFCGCRRALGRAYTELQYKRFSDVCEGRKRPVLTCRCANYANSGAIQTLREDALHDDPRGHYPVTAIRPDASRAAGARSETRHDRQGAVVQVRDIPANTTISYGRTFETAEPTRMAVISMGYADGYLRTGSGKAQVLLGGVKAPVLGRICMDMCMVRIPEA